MPKGNTLEPGTAAPDFCLKDENGDEHCLSSYRGKWVVLYFYPRDDTPGCTAEAKDFSCSVTDFQGKNAAVIGVSGDSPESHMKFRLKHDLGITLLSDPGHEVLKQYGAFGEKKLSGKITLGITRSTYLIDPEGKITHVWPKVKVEGHVQDVLAKIG